MNQPHIRTASQTSLILVFAGLLGGCIHPNLTSIRYGEGHLPPQGNASLEMTHHGPESLFREQSAVPHEMVPAYEMAPKNCETANCATEGYLYDPSMDEHNQPDTPEAPWPRFHPLPTRPVLGPPPR